MMSFTGNHECVMVHCHWGDAFLVTRTDLGCHIACVCSFCIPQSTVNRECGYDITLKHIGRPYYLLEKLHWEPELFVVVSPFAFCVVRPIRGWVLFVLVCFGFGFLGVFCLACCLFGCLTLALIYQDRGPKYDRYLLAYCHYRHDERSVRLKKRSFPLSCRYKVNFLPSPLCADCRFVFVALTLHPPPCPWGQLSGIPPL